MAWSTPRTWNVGELVSKLIMDTHIRDNLSYLYDTALQVVARRGGSTTHWDTSGSTNYTPNASAVKMEAGSQLQSLTTNAAMIVTFPEAFTYRPIVTLTAHIDGVTGVQLVYYVYSLSNTSFSVYLEILNPSSSRSVQLRWMAIGE